MIETPFVSIVVNNYNYAHFLEQAIESALRQTYAHREVIVVDDGSTDTSRDVIANFGEQITPVFKHNEGQASTFNTGFERSRGEIVVYLDADDLLMPQAVERAVELFDSERIVKVHWPLWEMDAAGQNLGTIHRGSLIEGDFRDEFIRRGPIALPQSPTSGNAWARWFLEQVMPLPEHEDKHGADGFLKKLCPIYGEIRRVTEPQGYYRIHPSNYGGGRGTMFKVRRGMNRYPTYCRLLGEHLNKMGVSVDPDSWMGPDSQYAWLKNYVTASAEVDSMIPEGESLVLMDNGSLGAEFLPRQCVVPFPQHRGEFGGPPHDEQQAIAELDEQRREGVRWVVLAFTAFWWQDTYPQFFEHLRSQSDCLLENERLRVFALAGGSQAVGQNEVATFDSHMARSTDVVEGDRLNRRSELHAVRPNAAGAQHPISGSRSLMELCRDVFGRAPTDIQPLGECSNNCGAFKLRIKDQKIKCYECQSAERASLVEKATRILQAEKIPIPRILAVVDHIVFAEWINGKPLSGSDSQVMWQRMASYQARIHQASFSLSDALSHRFIHLEWLLERLMDASRAHVSRTQVQASSQALRELTPPGLKAGIVQPDFIKSNLVVTSTGELMIVDNELLGIGLGFEFDILNTSHVTSASDDAKRRRYLDAYAKFGDLGTLNEHEAFWDLCYLAKLAGKRFLLNDVANGKVCLELLDIKLRAYARGES